MPLPYNMKPSLKTLETCYEILTDLTPYGVSAKKTNDGVIIIEACGVEATGKDICSALVKLKKTIIKEN